MSSDTSERDGSKKGRTLIIACAAVVLISAAAVCCYIMFSDSDLPVDLDGNFTMMNITVSFDSDSGSVKFIATEEDKMFAIAFTSIIVAEAIFMLALARYFRQQAIEC